MASDDFHKSSDGIPRLREAYSDMKELGYRPYLHSMLRMYVAIAVFALLAFAYIDWKRQNTCTRFLNYQSNYTEYLVEVDAFIFSVANDAFLSGAISDLGGAAPFSSQAALAIELSDPFGVGLEAAKLSEHMRSVSRGNARMPEAEVRSWAQTAIGLRDAFVTAVQKTNPCARSSFF